MNFKKKNDKNSEYRYRTLNLSSYLSLKDEAQLTMNEVLIDTVENSLNQLDNYERSNEVKSKLNELRGLTYEEDNTKKNKLIMNVSP